ncbi:MAG: PDZ domain-containing protein [Bacillota bacterium]
MFPLQQIVPMIVVSLIRTLTTNYFFWAVLLFTGLQYKRIAKTKQELYGVTGDSATGLIFWAAMHGLIGGLLGSFLMVAVGISITGVGIGYLWLFSLLLALVSPHLLCFSYSGGIISLSFLLFGFPKVDVPNLMGLVAVLHLVESFLILLSGHLGAIPVYARNSANRVVGGFNLQKFWPLPITALLASPLAGPLPMKAAVNMPSWWPLIRPSGGGDPQSLLYIIIPVVAALGYSDLALTSTPERKSKKTALYLSIFSLVLLGCSILASHYPGLAVMAALFGPLGHEWTILRGRKEELAGEPFYVSPPKGIRILDVFRGSLAARMGVHSGDIIMAVNGQEVNCGKELQETLGTSTGKVEVDFLSHRSQRSIHGEVYAQKGQPLGIIPVPEESTSPNVRLGTHGILGRLWRSRVN